MTKIDLFTIGFTKKSAKTFFTRLKKVGVKRVLDVRLNNVSQLAGFAKKDDLKFFLHELCDCEYIHIPQLAPTKEILDNFKKNVIDWNRYEDEFNNLLLSRKAENIVSPDVLNRACLLCSEHLSDNCHRRLIAEYLKKHYDQIEIKHL
jgi:uncharacterized protein (DUF488 family)